MSGKVIWKVDPETDGERMVMEAAARALRRTLLALEGFIRATLTGPRHGRVYRRGRRVHVASAPGEPPAVDTGNLVNSVAARPNIVVRALQAIGIVSVGAEYALFLEKGTKKMAKRPYAQKTLDDYKDDLFDLFQRLFRGYLG